MMPSDESIVSRLSGLPRIWMLSFALLAMCECPAAQPGAGAIVLSGPDSFREGMMPQAPAPSDKPLLFGNTGGEGWVLGWHDEFDGNSLERSRWDYRIDSKFGSVQLPQNVSVTDGRLILTLREQRVGDKRFSGAGVITKEKFFHGFYEARIKFPEASGWWSAFWLMKNAAGGRANAGTKEARQEIDIIEHSSGWKAKDGYQIAIHWWQGGHFVLGPAKVHTPFPLSGDFHVYGFDYGERQGVFYLDGRKVAEVDLSSLPPQEPMSIWLTSIQGMANSIETAKLPTRMEVDYVRFFQSQ